MPKWLSVLLHALVIAGGAYATIMSPSNAAIITAAAGSINAIIPSPAQQDRGKQ